MKHLICYWLVKTDDSDEDMFWYINERHDIGEAVIVNGIEYRVIDLDDTI